MIPKQNEDTPTEEEKAPPVEGRAGNRQAKTLPISPSSGVRETGQGAEGVRSIRPESDGREGTENERRRRERDGRPEGRASRCLVVNRQRDGDGEGRRESPASRRLGVLLCCGVTGERVGFWQRDRKEKSEKKKVRGLGDGVSLWGAGSISGKVGEAVKSLERVGFRPPTRSYGFEAGILKFPSCFKAKQDKGSKGKIVEQMSDRPIDGRKGSENQAQGLPKVFR